MATQAALIAATSERYRNGSRAVRGRILDNPGVYTVQQFRTFQRRQKQWRADRADAMILQPAVG